MFGGVFITLPPCFSYPQTPYPYPWPEITHRVDDFVPPPSPEQSSKEEESETLILPSSPSPPPVSAVYEPSSPLVSPEYDSPPFSPGYEPPEPGELPEYVIYQDICSNPEIVDLKNNPPVEYFGQVGLECYNLHKGTNLEFPDFFKLQVSTVTSEDCGLIFAAVERNSACEIETSVWNKGCLRLIIMLRGLKPGCVGGFDTLSVDASCKGDMPYYLPQKTLRGEEELDERIYYALEDSELEEYKNLFQVYAQLALFTQFESVKLVVWAMPLQVGMVIVQTKEDVEPKDKVKADNAIFYIRFSTRHDFSFHAVVRRTSDGNPHHISLEAKILNYY